MKGTAMPDAYRRSPVDTQGGLADCRSSSAVVRVTIRNFYADGHSSSKIVDLEPPGQDIDEWFDEVVWPHTGDGHGDEHPKLGFRYEVEIGDAADSALIGLCRQWDS